MLPSKARQTSDSGSVLYKKKFGLSSSGFFCFLLCLGEKICVGVLVSHRKVLLKIGNLSDLRVVCCKADYVVVWTVMTGAD